jgi:hypothetical protein
MKRKNPVSNMEYSSAPRLGRKKKNRTTEREVMNQYG